MRPFMNVAMLMYVIFFALVTLVQWVQCEERGRMEQEQQAWILRGDSNHQDTSSDITYKLDISEHQSSSSSVRRLEDDKDVAKGNFFAFTKFCSQSFFGSIFNPNIYSTRDVMQLWEFIHFARGGLLGTCATTCDDVCNHRPCYKDYDIFDNGDSCECFPDVRRNQCGTNTECLNDQCTCLKGYAGAPLLACVNINECSSKDLNNCGPNSNCIDEPGSFRCECKVGFTGEPTSEQGCVDINECEITPTICGEQGTCVNTVASYVCECEAGYSATGPDGICVDIDECQTSADTCGPNSTCQNLEGSFLCTCNAGYRAEENKPSRLNPCKNVDECVETVEICGNTNTTDCIDTPGSYTCSCVQGYQGNPPAEPCLPDACVAADLICDSNADCVTTTEGQPECRCRVGFSGNAISGCVDINECALNVANCQASEDCFNSPGSFACLIKEFRTCPVLGNNSRCSPGMECAQLSRSDSSPICCSLVGICSDGASRCCNGAYTAGDPCPSKSNNDCEGTLTCGRTLTDPTFKCCRRTEFNSFLNYRVCLSV